MCKLRLIAALSLLALYTAAPALADPSVDDNVKLAFLEVSSFADDEVGCIGTDPDRSIRSCSRIILGIEGIADIIESRLGHGRRNIPSGYKGPEIEALQSFLAKQGFSPGAVDGVYGAATHQALQQAIRRLRSSVRNILVQSIKEATLAEAFYYRGNAYYYKGDYDRAIADYNQVIRLKPDFAEAYKNRGLAYLSKVEYDPAIADLEQAIRLKLDFAEAYLGRGLAYYSKGEYDPAIADYDQAITLKPDFAEAYVGRGFAYSDKGEYDRAIADFDQGITLKPDFADAEIYFNRGQAYSHKGDYDRAIADYDQAITLNPDFADAYYSRAEAYNGTGHFELALSDFREALRLFPSDSAERKRAGLRSIAVIEERLTLPPPVATPAPMTVVTPQEPKEPNLYTGGGIVVKVSEREIDGQNVAFVSMTGEMKFGDENYFNQALMTVRAPVVIVSLQGPGGAVDTGIKIGRIIWNNQYKTLVGNEGCYSMCAYAWLAGRPRYASPGAQIGFHAPWKADADKVEVSSVGSAVVGGYLADLGFTTHAMAYMTEPGPDEMQVLTAQDAQRLGIYFEAWR